MTETSLFSNIPGDGILYAYEGTKSVFDIDLASPDGTALTFQIVGGADAGRFTIDPETGLLSFVFNPDWENPASAKGTNNYDVTVRILTAGGLIEEKTLTVQVLDQPNDAPALGSISGHFFSDTNSNNLDDDNTAIKGATVQLWKAINGHWTCVQETTTDANGNYTFTNLAADPDYRVRFLNTTGQTFVTNDAGNDAIDSDAVNRWVNDTIGQTSAISLAAGQKLTDIDAGVKGGATGSISGHFFADSNGNSIDDNGDVGVAGQAVQLWRVINGVNTMIRETVTDANGDYTFGGLEADTQYRVRFFNATGLKFVTRDVGSDDSVDSDILNRWPSDKIGQTNAITVAVGQQVSGVDAGVNDNGIETHTLSTVQDGEVAFALGAELLVNGGFEEHPWATSATGVWGLSSANFNGWTAVGTDGVELQKGSYGTGNAVGNTIVELDRYNAATNSNMEGIAQTVTITEAGTYRLSLDYYFRNTAASATVAGFAKATNAFNILVDGVVVKIGGADVASDFVTGRQSLAINLQLTAGSHTISLVENNLGVAAANDGAGASVDNVSLKQVYASFTAEELEQLSSRVLGKEIIVNGGFETHANAGKISTWHYDSITGWSTTAGATKIEVQTGDYGTGNVVGNAIVELDDKAGSIDGIKQVITITEAGTYQLSFDYGMRAYNPDNEAVYYDNHSNAIKVLIDGVLVTLAGAGEDNVFDRGFQHKSVDIQLTAGSHTIEFIENPWNSVGEDGSGAELDNVSLRKVDMVVDKGVLSGTVYYDGDQDNRFDSNEDGLGGRTVYLLNTDGTNVTDASGHKVSTTTDANGDYTFAAIAAGTYRVGTGEGTMKVSDLVSVVAGNVTSDVDVGQVGRTADTVIKVCENTTFVQDFDTTCKIISEDVYFMTAKAICARIGHSSFDEDFSRSWNNGHTIAVDYYVFLKEPADSDLTFTLRIVTDKSQVPYDGTLAFAPNGFAYFTNQANEINAPQYQEIEVTVKAGQTKSSAFYVGTELAGQNYYFGMEIDSVYNRDLNEMCARVARVVTTPIALDLNRDGHIGVTGESTSSDKAGLTVGHTVLFDMNGDGTKERMEWFDGSGDGILVDNRDGKAMTDMTGLRLFGDEDGKFVDGYAKLLAQFDTNHDGQVSGAELNGLQLWVDDGDAVVELGELQSLAQNSVTSISGIISVETDALGREILRSTATQDFEASGNVTYKLEGTDAALFQVDAAGKVTFINAPDYENPQDKDGDNVYEVTLVRITSDPTCKPARENLRIEICDKPSLGDTVWFDTNKDGIQNNGEKGVAGVTVQLLNTAGVVIATTTTNANGNYLFDDLNPGDYRVKFVAPSGYAFTVASAATPEAANGDSDANTTTGITGLINLVEGEHQRNVDAGLIGTASLGDLVWYDTNKNGVKDTTESGAAGVTVKLLNAAGTVLATTTTDASGNYLFSNLDAGDYKVQFVAPNGYVFTTASSVAADAVNNDSDANTTTGITGVVNLSIGEAERDVDAGLKDPGTASLGDLVWYDTNKNGVKDTTESGAAGVTVKLLNAAGTVLATTTTDASGNYLFSNLDAGDYKVQFVAPNGYVFTTASSVAADAVNNDSDANTTTGITGVVNLSIGEAERDVDAGLKDPGTASLGDLVWYDTNKNGVKDTTESGAAGVTVKLLNAAGTVLATTTTDASGNYLFSNLDAGDYKVQFVAPNGYVFTTASSVAADAVNNDSDANTTTGITGVVNLSIGEAERDVDAGLKDPGTASLGDTVWYDTNKNGVLDTGEAGASGVTVNLLSAAGAVLATTTTDASGKYLFDHLDAGDYRVQFAAPTDYHFTTASSVAADAVNNDSDANTTTGITGVVNLSIGEAERDVDAGLVQNNHGPAAMDDTGKTCADTPKAIDVLANDSDADGDSLTITAVNGTSITEGQTITAIDGVKITLSGGSLVFDATGTIYEDALIGTHTETTYTYTISDGQGGVDTADIDMTFCGVTNTLETIAASLPDDGVVRITLDTVGSTFYSALITQTGDDRFDGKTFGIAFCGNSDLNLKLGVDFTATFHLGTEATAPDSITHPENLDLVNWILNQDFTSIDNGDGVGKTYTEGEIQGAIWGLTDGFVFVNENFPAFGTTANAQEIYNLALANGEGYVPGEHDIVSIILDPTDDAVAHGSEQPFIIGVEFSDLAQDCFCF